MSNPSKESRGCRVRSSRYLTKARSVSSSSLGRTSVKVPLCERFNMIAARCALTDKVRRPPISHDTLRIAMQQAKNSP
ncbi:Uncharacterised protein [Mycobacteroides abscessus subsp. abscessus]|nr:Uncharacterised protein [Mycobacteroides abscessus subsp. abscessus]